jgi:hypothetical protein
MEDSQMDGKSDTKQNRVEGNRSDSEDTAKNALEAYGYCTNVLRLWFGTYSIGAPALILSNDKLRQVVMSSAGGKGVLSCFAGAIALQVFLTFVNKFTQYGVYELHGSTKTKNWFTLGSEKVSDWIIIDLIADVATIVFLALGTIRLYGIVSLG